MALKDYSNTLVLDSCHDALSSESLLRPDNYIMPHQNSTCERARVAALSCCLPCWVHGTMAAMINREEETYLGVHRLQTCAITAPLCIIGWPVSPLLALYTCLQRQNLKEISYHHSHSVRHSSGRGDTSSSPWGGDEDKKHMCSICVSSSLACIDLTFGLKSGNPLRIEAAEKLRENLLTCLFWPCATAEHWAYLQGRNDVGLLPFPWEYDLIPSATSMVLGTGAPPPPPPPTTTSTVLIIGPPTCGKTSLFQKILRTTNPDIQQRIIRSGDGSSAAVGEEDMLRIGLCATAVSDERIRFIEAWDVPYRDVMSHTPGSVLYKTLPTPTNTILLVFDCTSRESLFDAVAAYNRMEDWLPSRLVLLVAHKCDLLREELDLARMEHAEEQQRQLEAEAGGSSSPAPAPRSVRPCCFDQDDHHDNSLLRKRSPKSRRGSVNDSTVASAPAHKQKGAVEGDSKGEDSDNSDSSRVVEAELSTNENAEAEEEDVGGADSDLESFDDEAEIEYMAESYPALSVLCDAMIWARQRHVHMCRVCSVGDNEGVNDVLARIKRHTETNTHLSQKIRR